MRKAYLVLVGCWIVVLGMAALTCRRSSAGPPEPGKAQPGVALASEAVETPGSLTVLDSAGNARGVCPLKHTDVDVAITGFLARVTMRQQFHNPYKDKIEAVYTFPLSQDAAVDDMEMKVGKRTIRGEIRKREEARRIYEAAKQQGKVASLLDQERPNIFTQSVANIMPGEDVTVALRYTELVKYEDGQYEFVFPMVVGPRYIPGQPTSRVAETPPEMKGKVVEVPGPTTGPKPKGTGWSPDTNQVPDASRITPPVTAPGTRAGHDLSLTVRLDAGRKLQDVKSVLHEVERETLGQTTVVRLKDKATIPNKDFILRYSTATSAIGDAVFTHSSEVGKFVALVLEPPKRAPVEMVTPKELVFVLDTSGSMSGYPIDTAKATMKHCLAGLNPKDTFNLVTFSGDTRILFEKPMPATPENVQQAQDFLATRQGGGGTEMMKAIKAALDPSDSQQHVRIVCFMTDGYVGNDMAILGEIRIHPNARVFSFGIGNSVNRFLLGGMARAGRGEVQYVTLGSDGEPVAKQFYERFRNPLLTDIELDWGDLPVTDVYPKELPDLYSAKPLVVRARYTKPATGALTLRGKVAGKPFARKVPLDLPKQEHSHEVLGPLWARARIDDLMTQDMAGMQSGQPKDDIRETITNLGLEFRLMTQFTSFVAVEEMTVTEGGQPRTITVPVEMPEGVSYEGVFGGSGDAVRARRALPGQFSLGLQSLTSLGPYDSANAVTVVGSAPAPSASAPGAPGVAGKPGAPGKDGAPGPAGPRRGGGGGLGGGLGNIGGGGRAFDAFQAEEPARVDLTKMKPEERRAYLLKQRLDPALAGLAEKVAKQGKDGNLKLGTLEVKKGIVEVAVWLVDTSDANLAKLKELGLKVTVQARAVKMVVGRIDMKKLEELALLEFVRRVEPPRYGT